MASFCTVFRIPSYLLIATTISWFVFSLAIWLPNLTLISVVLTSETATLLEKSLFVLSLYGGIFTNFTVVSAVNTIAIALLAGIYSALFVYYLKRQMVIAQTSVTPGIMGTLGIVSGLFGIGCAACGTLLLSSLATTATAGALLLWLPFGGEEFGILGVALLLYSVYALLRKINSPNVCKSY